MQNLGKYVRLEQSMADEKSIKTVTSIIEEVCEDICDNCCKYRETADENCECDAIRMFGKCPLDRLY